MSRELLTYEVLSGENTPILDGVFWGDYIYQFDISSHISEPGSRQAELSAVLTFPRKASMPKECSGLFEQMQEDGFLLECGEGSYGGIGFVALTSPGKELVFLACFEESNPFVAAERSAGKIRAVNNIGEIWTFDCEAPVPLITISGPADRGDWCGAWENRGEWKK